jgi:hypothetical protein
VRRAVPLRTVGEWNDSPHSFVEADFVAHGGTSVAGSFVQRMVLTDIATGWTECMPVVARNDVGVIEALTAAMQLFPFPVRGVDLDSAGLGSDAVPRLPQERPGPCRAEERAIVRRLVGYGRFEGLAAAKAPLYYHP